MDAKKIIAEETPRETEISFLNLFKSLWHRAWIIILAAAVAAAAVFFIKNAPAEPYYESEYTLYLAYDKRGDVSDGVQIFNIADKKDNRDLLDTYRLIATNSRVLARAAAESGVESSEDNLRNMLSINIPENGNLVYVTVRGSEADQVKNFAEALNRISCEETAVRMEGTVISNVEDVSAPRNISAPSSPIKYCILAAVMAAVIAAAVIVIKEIAEDRIKSAEALEIRSGILVLASVPNAAKLRKSSK